METDRIKNLVISHRQFILVKLVFFIHSALYGFALLLCTISGYIPSHALRNLLYKYLFKVKFASDSVIYWKCRFFDPWGVNIGHNSIVGDNAFFRPGRMGYSLEIM